MSDEAGEGLNWMSQKQILGENKPLKAKDITEEVECEVGNDKTIGDVRFT